MSGVEPSGGGWGSWCVLATLLCSTAIVLGIEWEKKCDAMLRSWLLVSLVVTTLCGILGALFHGRGESRSRFLDHDSLALDRGLEAGLDLEKMENRREPEGVVRPVPLPNMEVESGAPERNNEPSPAPSSLKGDISISSARSVQLASRASASLQRHYFGPGPKVYPDAVFLLLVASQWFLAGWSVVGAVLYVKLFDEKRTCSPLLRHWTLLIVIIGFLSCLLAACYTGIMICMLGSVSGSRELDEKQRFQNSASSSGSGRPTMVTMA